MRRSVQIFIITFSLFILTGSLSSCAAIQYSKANNSVVIGQITDLTGDFIDGWTNGAADRDVRALIHGYSTVTYTREGTYEVDPTVVEKVEIIENSDGSKQYIFRIRDDLIYNNGQKITAEDYVFRILLWSSPEIITLGAAGTDGLSFVGYEDYNSGITKTFAGVSLIDEYTFALTIDAKELPYCYEETLVEVSPVPVSVYAPGVTIQDDGQGAFLSDQFTVQLIQGPINEQRWNPTVTCGPYQLESYDTASRQAVICMNPNYNGNYEGQKPRIERIVFTRVTESTMMDELANGNVDLLTNVSGGSLLNAGMDLVDAGICNDTEYLRNGYGKLAFICDIGPTRYQAVRQAIAYCLDREEFAEQYSGGYAQVVNGYYGLGQPIYQKNKEELNERLNPYFYNLDAARDVLEEDGWIYNKDGTMYEEGKEQVRCKLVDGELVPCVIKWGCVENFVSKLLSTMLPVNMEAVGMKLEITYIDFSVLINSLSRNADQIPMYNMFNMGVTFTRIFDPYYSYSTNAAYDSYNDNKIYDIELETIAKALRETESEDSEEYAKEWVKFQDRWNELLPDLPLYSDLCHDFYNSKIKNYEVNAQWDASAQMIYCYIEN